MNTKNFIAGLMLISDGFKLLAESCAEFKVAVPEIDKIDSVIDSLEKENDQKQLALNIAKAEKELAEARRKRNVGVLQANGTISYQADPEAITEAQNNLNELYLKRTTEALEQQKEILQKNKEIESDNYDAKLVVTANSMKGHAFGLQKNLHLYR